MTNEPLNLEEIAPLERRLEELRAELCALKAQSDVLLRDAQRASAAIQSKNSEVYRVESQIRELRVEARRRAIEAAWIKENPALRPLHDAPDHTPLLVFLDYEEDSDYGDFPAMDVVIARKVGSGTWYSMLVERDYDGGGSAKTVRPICWMPMPEGLDVPSGISNA